MYSQQGGGSEDARTAATQPRDGWTADALHAWVDPGLVLVEFRTPPATGGRSTYRRDRMTAAAAPGPAPP